MPGKGLFNEYVFPIFKRTFRKGKMLRHRSDNGYCVNTRVVEDVCCIRRGLHGSIHPAYPLQGLHTKVANGNHSGFGMVIKVAYDVRSPVSVTDDTDL